MTIPESANGLQDDAPFTCQRMACRQRGVARVGTFQVAVCKDHLAELRQDPLEDEGWTPVMPAGPVQLPEAAFSLNTYVQVPGLTERVQVTARSSSATDTPEVVAAQFRAMCAAVQAPPQAPAASRTREEHLSQLLACGIRRALAKEDLRLLDRLTAAFLTVVRGLVSEEQPGMLLIRSLTATEQWYTVTEHACTCKNFVMEQAREQEPYVCKHILAYHLYMKTIAA
jgi:hypothetical protein